MLQRGKATFPVVLSDPIPEGHYTSGQFEHISLTNRVLSPVRYATFHIHYKDDGDLTISFTIFVASVYFADISSLTFQHRGEWEPAKVCFQNSLSINPSHLPSLQALGLVYLELGSPRLAEQTLRTAIKLDPQNYKSWFNLGTVLEVGLVASRCW